MSRQPTPPRLPQHLLVELEGLPWVLVCGKKHWQLRIGGDLVAVLPHGKPREHGGDRNRFAVRTNIRHWKQEKAI